MKPEPRYKAGDKIGGRYLVHDVKMGGMGEVYLCIDQDQNEPYALKTFQERFLTNPKLRDAFNQEVATWVTLEKHPNIVRCYHLEHFNNQPFMVLEWIFSESSRGADLRSWIQYGLLDSRLALELLIDVCRGLIYAGAKSPGIVHRDLKPENILILQDRIAKITDWGLAKIIQDSGLKVNATSRDSNTGGTPLYMAPEQWLGKPLDLRTDIYATGCILFELFTGHFAFNAEDYRGLAYQHIEGSIPHIRGKDNDDLNNILDACLAKQPSQRFTSFNELLDQFVSTYEKRFSELPRELLIQGGNEFSAVDYNNRSAAYCDLKMYKEALADSNRSLQLDPSLVHAYISRGNVYLAMRDYDEAIQDLKYAIQMNPSLSVAYHNLGTAYEKTLKHKDALFNFNKAIELDPQRAETYSSRGSVYENMLQLDKALADHEKAVQLQPELAQVYVNRGALLGVMGRFNEALADANHAIQLDPMLSKAYLNRAIAYMSLGRIREAQNDFEHAIKLDPNDPQPWYNRAKLHDMLRNHKQALADYSQAIQLDPNYGWAYNSRGVVYSQLNQKDLALKDFAQAISIDPDHILAYTNRGTEYLQLRRYKDAITDFSTAIQKDPENLTAIVNRGAAYYQSGQIEEALADFQKAVQIDPNNAIAQRNLGLMLYVKGKLKEALQYLEKAIDLGDRESQEYVREINQTLNKGEPMNQKKIDRIIQRLKTDHSYLEQYRANPLTALDEYDLTVEEALELVATKGFPMGTIQDMQAMQKLLEHIANL